MKRFHADVVICGAGIAGISAAYHLSVHEGVKEVLLLDERPPLTLTSDKSTECYRNWWPGPGSTMVNFVNRSIDLLEKLALKSENYFHMNRRGYAYLSADPTHVSIMEESAQEISRLGVMPLRRHRGLSDDPAYPPSIHQGFDPRLTGADLIVDRAILQKRYPFISAETIALLHPRRCGWLSAQQLGMYLLEQAKAHGVRLVNGRITGVAVKNGQIESIYATSNGDAFRISTRTFVIAAGPLLQRVGAMIGLDLPVFNELHGKVVFNDSLGIVPRDVPLMIWNDPITLTWTQEEREDLATSRETRWLLDELPGGVHFRPEGGSGSHMLLVLWAYHIEAQEPIFPPTFSPHYAEIVMRGLKRMVPGFSVYLRTMGRPVVDGGYYCKTRENRPLIGPLPVKGAFIIGALSGFGIMAAMAAGELLAKHVTGAALPHYASAFLLSRYEDPSYQRLLANWDAGSGQL
jgi:glycine/D-amino acid oxidase-like deaminating enzyme